MDIKLNVSTKTSRLDLDVQPNRWALQELGQKLRDADMAWLSVAERYIALKRLKDASELAKVPFEGPLEEEFQKLAIQNRAKESLRTELRALNTFMADEPRRLQDQMQPNKPKFGVNRRNNRAFIPYPAGPVNPNEIVYTTPKNMHAYDCCVCGEANCPGSNIN